MANAIGCPTWTSSLGSGGYVIPWRCLILGAFDPQQPPSKSINPMPYNFVVCRGLHQGIITIFFGVEVSFDENQAELLLQGSGDYQGYLDLELGIASMLGW